MTPDSAARILYEAAAKGVHYPEELRGQLTVEAGYRVQQAVLALHQAAGEEQAGWKIGFTAPAVRAHFGSSEPVFGYLLTNRGFSSGLSFSFADMINPSIESELCFTLGKPLKGPGVTAEQVADAIATVAPAFEIIEGRGDMKADLGLGIADNVLQSSWVTGAEVRPYPREIDLGAIRAEITRNGEGVVDVLGKDAIDNQHDSIAWLANEAARYGGSLKVGQRILSGSFSRPLPIARGDRWETRFSGIGSVAARFD
ncbi:MAG TPA: fumarylacetoacetate hydrolase family protein [bacterium]|jgi:2-keto-4-pentenoate hydratase